MPNLFAHMLILESHYSGKISCQLLKKRMIHKFHNGEVHKLNYINNKIQKEIYPRMIPFIKTCLIGKIAFISLFLNKKNQKVRISNFKRFFWQILGKVGFKTEDTYLDDEMYLMDYERIQKKLDDKTEE